MTPIILVMDERPTGLDPNQKTRGALVESGGMASASDHFFDPNILEEW